MCTMPTRAIAAIRPAISAAGLCCTGPRQAAIQRVLGPTGLANLHAALRGCAESLFEREDLVPTICEGAMPRACRAMDLDAQWNGDFARRFANTVSALPRQIVHSDLNPNNILLRRVQTPAFLDFDLARILPCIFDIGYAAQACW